MPILKSWKGFNPKKKEHQAHFKAKLGEFLAEPIEAERKVFQQRGRVLAKLAEFTAHTNTAAWDNVQNVIEVFADDVGDMDMGWMLAYDEVDLTDAPKSSFDVLGHASGMTFEKVPDGHRARIFGISGNRINVAVDTYGAGIGFLQNWFDDQEWWNIEDAANKYRFAEADQKAVAHYGLVSAVDDTVTYDATGATTKEKDANTIAAGVAEIVTENASTGLGITAQTQFLLYTNTNLYARALAAINTVVPDTNKPAMPYNVRPISTVHVPSTHLGWLVVPGRKSKHGRRLNLEILSDFDITMRAQDFVGWYRYGAFANAGQIRRLAKS